MKKKEKGLSIVSEKMAFLIILVIIVMFLLVWLGLGQTLINYISGEKLESTVQTCEQLGTTTFDPEDPTKKICT